MITDRQIIALVQEKIEGSDIFLVEVVVKPGNMIRVHLDRPEGISIEECVRISRFINEKLDRDVEDYSLEVSSPGVNAPYRVKQQYEKNVGRTIDLKLGDGEKIEGILEEVREDSILVRVKGREKEILFKDIIKAKTILSFN